MSGHTPGPWHIDYAAAGGGNIQSVNGPVANTRWFGNTQKEALEDFANARLIAAAPDLLEALKDLARSLSDSDEDGLTEYADVMVAARSAIAKAEGRS